MNLPLAKDDEFKSVRKYDWDKWLDYQKRHATQGKHFDCSIDSFCRQVRIAAAKRRMGVEIHVIQVIADADRDNPKAKPFARVNFRSFRLPNPRTAHKNRKEGSTLPRKPKRKARVLEPLAARIPLKTAK